MRLIDIDALPDGCAWCSDALVEAINDAPTIDAVEVVRCKDCKHGLKVVSPITAIFCTRFGVKDMAVEDDDFCSYGERGEADDES